ncbi:MAG: hypothetical protein KME15_00015 [Drouetiella hepatica Uher 2000/2452]|uniref:Uncharacterized protein n=1 Tax=Drouetiella hepatica Uher 2000/2452 TaxID=904376 RepID=A0A951UK86_9CYAN|nr:hypothetical protein [Drouetiella hepatica Uher 2000/2452]
MNISTVYWFELEKLSSKSSLAFSKSIGASMQSDFAQAKFVHQSSKSTFAEAKLDFAQAKPVNRNSKSALP